MAKKQAIINVFTSVLHRGSWREPGGPADQFINPPYYRELARTAERGKLHSIFISDTLSIVYGEGADNVLSQIGGLLRPEPFTLAASLAAITDKIGIIATANTTFQPPYSIARSIAMLDHISEGRAGWNIVTGHLAQEAANFGADQMMDHADRYERALEYVEVVKGLLDSWEDDAFPRNQETAFYMDPEKLHRLNHDGKYFKVAGPLNITRPPQGYPVFAQAGASKDGREFAAKVAEAMLSTDRDFEKGRVFYKEMNELVEANGRPPGSMKILPLREMVVEDTDAEASDKVEELNDLVPLEVQLSLLSQTIYMDISGLDIDGPLPEIPQSTERHQTRLQHINNMREKGLTIRQIARSVGAGDYGPLAGSPETIADHIEQWVTGDAADGFTISFNNPWRSLPKFVDKVVPEMQKRGIFHLDYEGTTLRDHFGLARPDNQYAK